MYVSSRFATVQFPCASGHVLWMISLLFKFAVSKARGVFELNRGVERRRRNVDRRIFVNGSVSRYTHGVQFIGSLIERAQKLVVPLLTSRRRFARPLQRGRSCRGRKRPRGSRERAPVHVQCEPKDNDEVAHQQLPSQGWRSHEFGFPSRENKASRSMRSKLSPNCDWVGARAREDLRDFW